MVDIDSRAGAILIIDPLVADDLDIDLIAASLRADQGDVESFVEALSVKLEQALPGHVRTWRWRTRLFGPKAVRRIAVDLGPERFDLRFRDGALEAQRAKLSGGIVLKSETVAPEEWLRALGAALAEEAQRSASARQALERLLMS